ncbi:Cadmium, cobalt and zinc/H(+)-K(+) antiporter [compost metagenome]
MEGAPAAIDQTEVKNALLAIEGVEDVHDLHIWTITSGFDSLSGHVLIRDGEDNQIILQKAIHILEEQFHIEHSTIQVETAKIHHGKLNC